jgi:hypothetical protein
MQTVSFFGRHFGTSMHDAAALIIWQADTVCARLKSIFTISRGSCGFNPSSLYWTFIMFLLHQHPSPWIFDHTCVR